MRDASYNKRKVRKEGKNDVKWKLLGAIALLVPRFPRLKEWAYAGIFFDMTGAIVSGLKRRGEALDLTWACIVAIFTLVSWALRPPGRMLGVLLPVKRGA